MKSLTALAVVVIFASALFAQTPIPSGTILPVQLSSSIDTHKAKAGDRISARIMQDVDLGPGVKLRAGTAVRGSILAVDAQGLTMKFDQVETRHLKTSVVTSLRALASDRDVDEAQLPTNVAGGDRGSSTVDWNFTLIGGQAAYGRGGPVISGGEVVGRTLLSGGVLAVPRSSPSSQCRADMGNETPQSFWVFSSSACGVYGFDNLAIEHAGRTNPAGVIVLRSSKRIQIRGGSGLLLRVLSPEAGRGQ